MPMMNEDEEPRDWEMKDEEPPEQLRRKWEREEDRGPQTVVCSSCKKETPAENLTCVFCGMKLTGNQDSTSCPVKCFFTWVKRLFRKE